MSDVTENLRQDSCQNSENTPENNSTDDVTLSYFEEVEANIKTTLTLINEFTPTGTPEEVKASFSRVWNLMKTFEDAAKKGRYIIEENIIALTPIEKGTTHISTSLKVAVTETVKINVDIVRELKKDFTPELMIFWPFTVKELKLDKTKIEQLKAVNPELHKKTLEAITTTYGKPSFTKKEEKE